MLRRLFKCSIVALVAIFVVPLMFNAQKKEDVYAENNGSSYEVIFDKTNKRDELDLSKHKIELEIGKDVFNHNGVTTVSGATFKNKTKTKIQYNGTSATIVSETNQVEIRDGNKEIIVDNKESNLLKKQSDVRTDDCEFELENVAKSLGYEVKQYKNKYVLTRKFFTKRLIVRSNTKIYDETAVAMAKYNDEYIITYATEQEAIDAYNQFKESSSVESVYPDEVFELDDFKPNKSAFTTGYTFQSWGATVMGVEKYRTEIEKYGQLREVVVVVLDSGIDETHEWFQNRLVTTGFTSINVHEGTNPNYGDEGGHGSHVAGTICELTPNNVKILPVKIALQGVYGYVYSATQAFQEVIKENDSRVKVVNMSFGSETAIGEPYHQYFANIIKTAKTKGITSVAAAGNESEDASLHCPANIEEAITVEALAETYDGYEHASYSNFGDLIDFSAPGSNILSVRAGGGVTYKSGTSMAAPHVSAAVALMHSNPYKSYTPDQIEQELRLTCTDWGDVGKDKYFGYGIVNLQHIYAELFENTLSFNTYDEVFEESVTLEMSTTLANAQIYYTLNGTYPSLASNRYTRPITITQTTTVRAVAFVTNSSGGIVQASEVKTGQFVRLDEVVDTYFAIDAYGTITNYKGPLKEITVPETIKGIRVNGVGAYAFQNKIVTSVTLPNTATFIDDYAFTCCYDLETIIANGVIEVGREAFYNCSKLSVIELENVEIIQDYAFTSSSATNSSLTAVSFPQLTKVGKEAFAKCVSLSSLDAEKITHIANLAFHSCPIEELNLPNVLSIGNGAFAGDQNLTKLNAEQVTFIGSTAFSSASSLETINIPKIEYVGEQAFSACGNLAGELTLNNLIYVGPYAFSYTNISSLKAPNLKNVEDGAFSTCNQLKNVQMHKIEYIGSYAFDNCSNLEEVELSNCVVYMGELCFSNNLTTHKIYSNTIAKNFLDSNGLLYTFIDFENEILTYEVKNGEVSIKGFNSDLMPNDYIIPATINNMPVVRICANAFKNCLQLVGFNLPYVRMVEESAFENCLTLESAELINSTTIQKNAFNGCENLSYLQIESISSIGDYAFLNCENLNSVKLEGFEEFIGEYAFGFNKNGNSYVKNLNFQMIIYPDSIAEGYATDNNIACQYIEVNSLGTYYYVKITNDQGVEQAGISSVYSTYTGELELPRKLNSGLEIVKICKEAFKYNPHLTKIYIPSSIKTIETSAFEGCSGLQEVYAEGVTEIKDHAFRYCEMLNRVVAPNLESIYEGAFIDCYNLESITTNNLVSLGLDGNDEDSEGGHIFHGCYKLSDIYLPTIEYIYGNSFSNTLKNAFFTNTLKSTTGNILPTSTKVYGYNHDILKNAVSGNEFEELEENFEVLINSADDSIDVVRGEKVYLEAITNGFNVLYQWYIQNGSESFSPIVCEDFKEILLKDFGSDLYKLKVMAMNWDGTIAESSPVTVRILEEGSISYQIQTEQEGLGSIVLSETKVYAGDSISVSIIPQEGYELSKILINGQETEIKTIFTINNINENITIKVVFEKIQFTITIIQSTNGIIFTDDESSLISYVGYGDNSSIYKFKANEGYHLKNVIINSDVVNVNINQVSQEGYVFVNVRGNYTISAEFEINQYSVTINTEGLDNNMFEEKTIQHGSNVELEVPSIWNYQIVEIKINNQAVSLGEIVNNVLKISNVTENKEVIVTYQLKLYKIELNNYANGMIKVDYVMSSSVQHMQTFKLSIKANEGYELKTLIIDSLNVLDQVQNNEIFINISNDIQAIVEFTKIKFTIIVEQANYGKIILTEQSSLNATQQVDYGCDSKVYMFIANVGYTLKEVIVDGERIDVDLKEIATNGYSFTNVKSNHVLTAKFEIETFNITTEIIGVGQVLLSASVVNYGESVTVDVINADYSEIVEVYVNDVKMDVPEKQFTINNITENVSVKAVFAVKLYIVNIKCSEGGTITPNGVFEIQHGETIIFEILPDEGYRLKEFKLNGTTLEVQDSYTLENITSRKDIEVTFERIMLTLIVSSGEHGTITPQGEMIVKYGDNKLLQITPDDGYGISRITINGVEIEKNKNIILNYITKNTIVSVDFEKTFEIKTTSNYGGIITESTNMFKGESKEIHIEPKVGFKIENVIIDGVNVGAVNSYKFENISKEHTVEVRFAQLTFNIIISVKNDSAKVVCDESLNAVAYGDSRTIHIEPKGRYKLPDTIVIDGKETEITNGIIILNNITNDVSIEIKMIKGEKEKVNILPIVLIIASSLLIAGGIAVAVVLIVKHKKKHKSDDLFVNEEGGSSEPVDNSAVLNNNMRPKVLQRNNATQSPTLRSESNQMTGAQPQASEQNESQQQVQMNNGVANSTPASTRQNSVNSQSSPIVNSQSRPAFNPQGRPIVNTQPRPINNSQNTQQTRSQSQVGQTNGMMRPQSQMVRPQQPQQVHSQPQTRPNAVSQRNANSGSQTQPQRVIQPHVQSNLNQGLQNRNINTANNQNSTNVNKIINNQQINRNSTENPQDKK